MTRKELYQRLKAAGLTARQEQIIAAEMEDYASHEPPPARTSPVPLNDLYSLNDLGCLQNLTLNLTTFNLRTLDQLLERDKLREVDGFPRKIRIGRMVRPGRSADGKVVVVPTTVEEKFIHDNRFNQQQEGEGSGGGSGAGEEGEVIGEQPVRPQGEGEGSGAGKGKGADHEMESSAYDLGRILTEKFQLPNLKDKGKKRSLTRYTYDLTDKNRGFGQVLDKKATLKQVLQTNIGLGNLDTSGEIDTTRLLIAPRDKVYRILSREKDYESQALVFFVRDYSGSMAGKATELIVTQHVLIYSWLLYQYSGQVETRFILHDTEAKEVENFHTYYNSRVAGGTQVAAAYRMVNELVQQDSLDRDYNIYIFHGTDGDDWDREGRDTLPELKKMLGYASRVGITIAEHSYGASGNTEVQTYLKKSGLLEQAHDMLRVDNMAEDEGEDRIIEGIRRLISE
ncbi:DUF444 family protein [Geopsychrobacter electrodiphilus]|uniref:DUF444 family protein n=1 Tax=Geopsychrobacter electrodiphilus TaxID=225196 RepID=UPI0003783F2C|nr:DUF444 family protein [Geopsychrobacter electrodiphilus]